MRESSASVNSHLTMLPGSRLARASRIGDVEREHALAAAAEAADQVGSPGATDLDVLIGQLAVDVVAVLVVLHRQLVESFG